MVSLLVGLSIMAIMMTVVMPTWRLAAQREKEAELVFRGQQYARAIGLFQKKSGPGVLPPNVDVLVEGHFLRKKYKDPITGQDFDLLTATQQTAPGPAGSQSGPSQGGRAGAPPARGTGVGAAPTAARGGIQGVASKSRDSSIRIYNGRTHYNEWQFVYVAQVQAPGQGVGLGGQPQRGGQSQGPGGFPGVGGVGGGRDGGRGRGGQGTNAPFGRGDAQPPSGRGSSGGLPPSSGFPPRR